MDKQEEKLFSIEEASLKLKIPKHTLRFWEKVFEGIFVPYRTPGGQRRYTLENIATIGQIKELKRKGMRLSDIKREFTNDNNGNFLNSSKADLLANKVAEIVRVEVYNILKEE